MNTNEILKAFATLLRGLATQSVCKRRGVACVVLNQRSLKVVGWGINGPAGYESHLCSGEKDRCGCIHSEVNTLLNCRPTGQDYINGCIMLATRAPCVPCASAIANSNFVTNFVYLDESEPGAEGFKILKACGISVVKLEV